MYNDGDEFKLHSTVCQDFLGYQFFDFKSLDLHMRETEKKLPATIQIDKNAFSFKLC